MSHRQLSVIDWCCAMFSLDKTTILRLHEASIFICCQEQHLSNLGYL